MIFIMTTRSMTRTSDWRRHDARRLVEVEARCCASCCCTSSSSSAASSFDVVVIVWRERRRRRRRRRRRKKNKNFQGRRKSSRTMPFFGLFSFHFFRGNAYGLVKKKKRKIKKKKKKDSSDSSDSSAEQQCLVRVVSLGPTAPKQCVWTCTKNAIGCWLCRPHSESERRAEGHVDASNAYGLVLFVRRALTGGVGCEDTDRRSSSAT
ncbi:unnamed protein product [Trichogramma brassicae]|uniref:Uncharacterized protein n=1 Tax=Trichogramma brassicae TaxID=86971 RepID=A0A6H5IQH3_9HYME|nr:unnamed protein product [Trichogramma brassicae]